MQNNLCNLADKLFEELDVLDHLEDIGDTEALQKRLAVSKTKVDIAKTIVEIGKTQTEALRISTEWNFKNKEMPDLIAVKKQGKVL